jgi:formate dehydrogenase assembly factor FdhD
MRVEFVWYYCSSELVSRLLQVGDGHLIARRAPSNGA